MWHRPMSRVTRAAIGLIALLPVLGIAGGLLAAAGVGGEATAWLVLFGSLAWILFIIWWALRAPPARSEAASDRYWVALRHARFPRNYLDYGVKEDDRAETKSGSRHQSGV